MLDSRQEGSRVWGSKERRGRDLTYYIICSETEEDCEADDGYDGDAGDRWLVYYSVSLLQLGLLMTHNPPRMKTNMTAIFCKAFMFKQYMYGRGIARSAISVKMLGTATPMKYLRRLMQ
jgi:hypothetical protein